MMAFLNVAGYFIYTKKDKDSYDDTIVKNKKGRIISKGDRDNLSLFCKLKFKMKLGYECLS